jgi:hypothetical protein
MQAIGMESYMTPPHRDETDETDRNTGTQQYLLSAGACMPQSADS